MPEFWAQVSFWVHILAAFANAALAVWLTHRERVRGGRHYSLAFALALGSFWALAVTVEGSGAIITMFAESLRNFGFLCFMYSLLRSNNVGKSASTIPAIYAALTLALVLQTCVDLVGPVLGGRLPLVEIIFYAALVMRMIFAVGALVLVHNLYTLASPTARWGIRLPMTALAALWAYDLNLYTIAYLSGTIPLELRSLQGLVSAMIVPLFALAAHRNATWKVQLSRSIAFQSLSLVAIGGYMMAMVLIAQGLRMIGGDFARLAQVSFVFGMLVAALVLLPSGKFRAWFKVKVTKHLFQHRYDYRAEWMRFTDTIGRPGPDAAPFHARVIQAVADITDSPSGLLLTPDDSGILQLQARWNWPNADVSAERQNKRTIAYFESSGHIVELDVERSGVATTIEQDAIPAWAMAQHDAWVIVPLVHFDRLAGLVILSRPLVNRALDWEDYDMLRVVGRQVASYLAEEKSQEALLDAHRFDEFNRRFAFVMHDIKNLVSQLSLVAKNAEKHADNPEFRADMIETLGNSVDRMRHLIARLSNYGHQGNDALGPVRVKPLLQKIIREKSAQHPVRGFELADLTLTANVENLEQVLHHLVQNAMEASAPHSAVLVKFYQDGMHGCIEVQDNGAGMTPEFVRSKLFKPFVSSKNGGFGIGAFEALQLVQAMHGRLEVESRETIGSRFTVRLPLAIQDSTAAQMLADQMKDVA